MIDLRPHNDPKRLMDEAKDWAATCRQQKAELERLRAALEQIVAADDNYKAASNFMKDTFSDGYSDGLHDAAYVARTALEASSDNPTPEAYEAACKALWKHREENERLRAALQKLYDGLAWDWRGHPVGDLPTLREIARTALEGCTV